MTSHHELGRTPPRTRRPHLAGILPLLFALLPWVGGGCGGPTYHMDAPRAFVRYHETDALRMITAQGIMLEVREVENYPRADLPFWTDALERHLVKCGYTFQGKRCFRTRGELDGCTLNFLLPHGEEDWVMSETLFVVRERILLVEVSGPYPRYAKLEQDLRAALSTFRPGEL